MGYRTLEITLQYAKDLKKVNFITKMDVYVVVSISGGDKNSKQRTKTTVDHDGDANPMWRFPMKFTVDEAALLQNRLMLHFKLKCERALGDRVIGDVHVPIKDLLLSPAKGAAAANTFVSYQVMKPNGKPKGQLTFTYRFLEKPTTSAAAATPVVGVFGGSVAAVEPSLPYPPTAHGGYSPEAQYLPPVGYPPAGGVTPEWYPPPPWRVYPPPPPAPPRMMQMTPNWWIVDRRCDFRLN